MSFIDNYPKIKYFLKQNILPKYLWVRSLKYSGNTTYCPCCGGSFSKFIEIGPKKEPMQCPRCRSNDRDRFFWLYLEKHPDFFSPGLKLLHVSPEDIYYNKFRKIPGVQYTAGDKFILQFGNTYPYGTVYLDITAMPEHPDNSFDFIFCSHVLEYIKEDGKALKELFRVLKKGGTAIISVPIKFGQYETLEDPNVTDPHEQAILYGDTGHLRYYGEDYEERVQAAGFHTEFIPVADFISPELIKKCAIKPRDIVHLCHKV